MSVYGDMRCPPGYPTGESCTMPLTALPQRIRDGGGPGDRTGESHCLSGCLQSTTVSLLHKGQLPGDIGGALLECHHHPPSSPPARQR